MTAPDRRSVLKASAGAAAAFALQPRLFGGVPRFAAPVGQVVVEADLVQPVPTALLSALPARLEQSREPVPGRELTGAVRVPVPRR